MKELLVSTQSKTRLVIFLTAVRAADIPSANNQLACLLPFGTASFVEKVIESCALSGAKDIDLVVSDAPESLRAVLKDGSAWGVQLRWHLAKDSTCPYKVIRTLNFADDDLVVIGHAHQWVSARVVLALKQEPGVAMHISSSVSWTGWYSDKASQVCMLNEHSDYSSMTKLVASQPNLHPVLARIREFAQPDSAAHLLQAQYLALDTKAVDALPASWRRMPWGAMSPDAVVSVEASMTGPVLVGPGCVVERGANVGPNVVLSQDVFVSPHAEISNSLILSNTYIDGRVTLDNTVTQGNTVQNLKLDVRTVLDKNDAMVTSLFDHTDIQAPISSRIFAVFLIILLFPACFVLGGFQWLMRRPILWKRIEIVKSRNTENGELRMLTLRQPNSEGWISGCTAFYGALIDLAQNRRRWFGLRPRNVSEWYALGRDWQDLFGQSMLGVFHAPSWSEEIGVNGNESRAAADAFMAIHITFWDRVRLIRQFLFGPREPRIRRS